jgi:hypothetical protein
VTAVIGAIVIVIALLLAPVLAALGGAIIASALGTLLNADAKRRHEGSELLDVNV